MLKRFRLPCVFVKCQQCVLPTPNTLLDYEWHRLQRGVSAGRSAIQGRLKSFWGRLLLAAEMTTVARVELSHLWPEFSQRNEHQSYRNQSHGAEARRLNDRC